MRKSIFKVFGVLLLLVVIEGGTRGCVGWSTSRSIKSAATGVGKVTVQTGDLPVAFHFGILGALSNGSITLHDVTASPVNISSLTVSATSLKLSRMKMFSGKAQIKGSPPYTVQVVLSPANIGRYLNTNVTMRGGYLTAVIDSHPMEVKPTLKGRTIVLTDERNTYTVPLPGKDYLPCKPTGFGVGGGIAVSCQSNELPKVLSDALG